MKAAGFVGFLIGAVVGGGAGYFVGKRLQIKKNDREIDELTKYYDNKYKDAVTHSDIMRQKALQDKPQKTAEQPAEEALKLQKEKFTSFDRITPVKAPIEDYAAKYKKTTIKREEDDGPELTGNVPGLESDQELSDAEAAQYKHMIIISPEEWENDVSYQKNEVTYFEYNELFTDEYGHRIPFEVLSPDDVGRDNLDHFGISGDEGVLYVRDEENGEDYKIYLEESAYEGSTD